MSDVLVLVEQLNGVDVDVLERDELAAVVSDVARVRGFLDALDLRCVRRGRELAAVGQAEPPENLLGGCGNRSSKDSAAVGDREKVGGALPSFEDSLAGGDVSAGHLDAIACATRSFDAALRAEFTLHEADLLDHATCESVDVFTRRCRELARRIVADHARSDAEELDGQRAASNLRRWVDKATGMHHTHLELDPLRDAALDNALQAAIARRRQVDGNANTPWQQLQVDAFIDAATGGIITEHDDDITPASVAASMRQSLTHILARTETEEPEAAAAVSVLSDDPAAIEAMCARIEARVPEIAIHCDIDTLRSGLHEHSLCETDNGIPIPVSTVRRLCCDAEILPIVLNGAGEVLDVGRSKRTANRAQRRALRGMHRTCAYPGCTVPFSQTRAHHIDWWTRDRGPTNINNLLPLCEQHHHQVHEGAWTVTMTHERIATWRRPDGNIHHTGTTINRRTSHRCQRDP